MTGVPIPSRARSLSRPSRGGVALARLAGLLALVLLLLLRSRPAAAAGDPDLEWWTIETAHFRVHYPRHVEPVALRVAALAESIHDRLSVSLGYSPRQATEIVLSDDSDGANGSAIAIPYNTVRLLVSAPDDMSPLSDYDDWYLDLVTHEYTHILHTDNVSGIPAIVNAVLGKSLTPNRLQPNWIIEGLAVVKESEHTSAGRVRGSIYEMYIRADFLSDNVVGLDQLSNIPYRWPQRTIWYLYGSRFLAWISSVYGPNTMRAVAADYGSHLVPGDINRTIRRATGKTYVELYEGFKDHFARRYAAQMREVERRGLREGIRLTHHGQDVGYPRFVPARARKVPGREELLFFRDDTNERGGIYRLPLGRLVEGEDRDEELVARTIGNTTSSFTPDGDLVFSSGTPHKNVYLRNDIFTIPRGERSPGGTESWRRQLTFGRRASYPDVSPDGRQVAFTINSRGTSYLTIADFSPTGVANQRTLVPSARYEQAYTPRFSPDGKLLAYSAWTAGGYRDLRIVDVATGAFRRITHDRAVDMQPEWSSDGKTLYFCSDRTGIPNIYAYDLADGKLSQVTNVRTGAFAPTVSQDGKTLVYVGYTWKGYDLYAMSLDRSRFLEPLPPPVDRPDPPAEPSEVALRKHKYNPLPTLGPRNWSFEYRPGNYGGNALILTARGSDVVGHHSLAAQIVADTNAPEPVLSLEYGYGRLPFDYSARIFRSVVPRAGYRINDRDVVYNEYNTGITNGLNLPLPRPFSQHGIGMSYSLSRFVGDLPTAKNLDPYATATVRPIEGTLGVVHFGYGFSNVEGSLDAAGPARGVAFNLGIDVADDATLSDFTIRTLEYTLTTYFSMPWPGHHTLALRSAAGLSAGSYPRGALYFVGGYDLENNSLIDTITTNVFSGAFVMRGYEPRTYAGREYILENAEYRFPIVKPERGPSTLPVYLRRIDGNAFVDFGGAFNRLDLDEIKLFDDGYLINSPQLHTSVGAELWFGLTFAYAVNTQLRFGYAYGFSNEAIPGGQFYFVAAGAF